MTFTITIDIAGRLTKHPDEPWQLGEAGKEEHVICLVNNDNVSHELELVNFTHKQTGNQFKPIKGDRKLRADKNGGTDQFTVKTKKNSDGFYGAFLYWIQVDRNDPTADPEIVVDRPQSFSFKRMKTSHRWGPEAQRSQGAKKGAGSRKAAAYPKATRAAKATKSRKAKPGS